MVTARKLSPAKREKADRIHLRDCTVEREAYAGADCRTCEVCERIRRERREVAGEVGSEPVSARNLATA